MKRVKPYRPIWKLSYEGIGFLEAAEAPASLENYTRASTFRTHRVKLTVAPQSAQTMQPGEISQMITSGDTGIFVHLIERLVPDITHDDEELTRRGLFIALGAYTSGSSYANELF